MSGPRGCRPTRTARHAAALALCVAACGDAAPPTVTPTATPASPEAPAPWFREEARQRGIAFDHVSGATGAFWLPEIFCAGAALFDMDGDGDLDAYLVQSGSVERPAAERPGDRLFRNRGDGTFEDVTAASGVDVRTYGMGVAAGDVDRDGDLDLVVTSVEGCTLLRNDGGGRFEDATDAAGLRMGAWGTSAAFADFDRDGDLDLYVACYVRWSRETERRCDAGDGARDYCSPKAYAAPAPDHLFLNDGSGRFTDVSEKAGLRAAYGNGLGVTAGDFDLDGRPDVFVANDGVENQLWMQRPDGTFRDESLTRGCAMDRDGTPKAGMGTAAADVDDDGDLDLYVVNLVNEGDSLYRNEGAHFTDRTTSLGVAAASRGTTRFGLGFRDFDLDGVLDLFVVAGGVTRRPVPAGSDPYAQPNQLFRGRAGGRFDEVRPAAGTTPELVTSSRGAAFGDVDGDGDVDVLVSNRDGPAQLLVNVAPRAGGWAAVRLLGRTGTDEIGAWMTARVGPRRVWRDVRPGGSYCSSGDPRIDVGLGAAAQLEDVRVRWVDGSVEAFGDLAAGRAHALRRGAGRPSEWPAR